MLTETASQIAVAELVSDGIVVGFSDGTSALYTNQLLHDVRSRAEELAYEKDSVAIPE